jgi:hypothetical protein
MSSGSVLSGNTWAQALVQRRGCSREEDQKRNRQKQNTGLSSDKVVGGRDVIAERQKPKEPKRDALGVEGRLALE